MAANAPFSSVMLLVDGTDAAVRAADYAIDLCRFAAARLIAVAVVDTETLRNLLSSRIMVEAEMKEFEAELRLSFEKHLRNVQQAASDRNVTAQTVLLKGSTHSAVLEEIRRRKPDLLVMAGYSSSLLKRDLAARERQLVLDEATLPVLLVR